MAKKDYYKILNIDHKANAKAIKAAYRQMALKYHPDHNPNNPVAKQQFILIREAYEVLSSPDTRKKYDFDYVPKEEAPKAKAEPAQTGRARNLRYNLYISLEDVNGGCSRTIRYVRKNGGEKETVQVKVKVPKGAFHQQRLKLAGFGDQDGSKKGDLFVILHLQSHPIFLRTALNLRVNVPITYMDAALGNTIEIPTLSGTKKLRLKACVFEDISFELTGMGLPDIKGNYKGDLHVHCFIEHPTKLTGTEKNTLQKATLTWPKGEMMQQYEAYLANKRRS